MNRYAILCIGAVLLTAPLLAGCAPKEQPPATPPSLPPVPPRPANQGPSASRYQELMRQGTPGGGQAPTSNR